MGHLHQELADLFIFVCTRVQRAALLAASLGSYGSYIDFFQIETANVKKIHFSILVSGQFS